MTEYKVSYAAPTGKPLGTNFAFKIGTKVVIPLLNLVGKKVWRGGEKLPKTGKIIVASNHLSYLDVLFLTHFPLPKWSSPSLYRQRGRF
jgi:1-acyl-sn-glycerol-3-phosphate acyltransferase